MEPLHFSLRRSPVASDGNEPSVDLGSSGIPASALNFLRV